MKTHSDIKEASASPDPVRRDRFVLAHRLAQRGTVLTLLGLLAFGAGIPSARAQSNVEGSVFGLVLGASAAELAGATATLESKASHFKRSAPVSSASTFDFSRLPVGDYTISVALTGREMMSQDTYVSLATTTTVRFDAEAATVMMEKFVVSGANSSPVNVSDPEINFNVRVETVNKLPVSRDITSVAMTVAGVSRGDDNYYGERANGGTASFGGASVSENAYYLNGFNITDFRRGLGYANVPFEFLQEFHVKQFGYSAEFGRSTGGVVDIVSKRGSNDFRASINLFWEPASLRNHQPDSYRRDGTLFVVNSIGDTESKRYNFQASGPLVKNRLFFYGLYEGRDDTQNLINGTNQWQFRSSKNPFWAGRLDWQINDNHAVELTAFSDKNTRVTERYAFELTSADFAFQQPAARGASLGNVYNDFGGINQIARYTGRVSDDLNISVLYGTSKRDATIRSDVSADPYVIDLRTGSTLSGSGLEPTDRDERKALRVDGSYDFSLGGSHQLKFGYDRENNVAHTRVANSGGVAYTIDSYTDGSILSNGATAPNGTTAVATEYVFLVNGAFRVVTEALYAEDNWKLMQDRLLLRLGLRDERFENFNGSGQSLVKMDNLWAPRLSFAYDLKRDGRMKVVGGWGRYFLQIPANINVRQSGGEINQADLYVLNGIDANGVPILGAHLGDRIVYAAGVAKDPSTLVDEKIRPTYQDEFMLGFETALGKKWKASIKGVYKNMGSIVEDEAVDAALINYAAQKGYGLFQASGYDFYVLTNPGRDLNFSVNLTNDLNGDGVVNVADQSGGPATKEKVHIPAADVGYPRATRKYYAAILEFERSLADKWFGNFSYTWMHSYGNTEGLVLTEIGQDDGFTVAFDQRGLVDHSDGNLPNDHRHTFKANGGYQVTKTILVTANLICQSGRPLSGLGFHPSDPAAQGYGPLSHYVQGLPSPRGSFGRTSWVTQLDLGARYKPSWGRNKLTFGVDVFNILNRHSVTAVREVAETSTGSFPEPSFLRPRAFQAPRSVRLSATYDF